MESLSFRLASRTGSTGFATGLSCLDRRDSVHGGGVGPLPYESFARAALNRRAPGRDAERVGPGAAVLFNPRCRRPAPGVAGETLAAAHTSALLRRLRLQPHREHQRRLSGMRDIDRARETLVAIAEDVDKKGTC